MPVRAQCCDSMRDADHAMTCSKPGSVRTLHHDHLNEICCDAARCRRCSALHAAEVASPVNSMLREMQMQPGAHRHEGAHADARGDTLLAMPEGMLVIYVNIVHALSVTCRARWPQGSEQRWTAHRSGDGRTQEGGVSP